MNINEIPSKSDLIEMTDSAHQISGAEVNAIVAQAKSNRDAVASEETRAKGVENTLIQSVSVSSSTAGMRIVSTKKNGTQSTSTIPTATSAKPGLMTAANVTKLGGIHKIQLYKAASGLCIKSDEPITETLCLMRYKTHGRKKDGIPYKMHKWANAWADCKKIQAITLERDANVDGYYYYKLKIGDYSIHDWIHTKSYKRVDGGIYIRTGNGKKGVDKGTRVSTRFAIAIPKSTNGYMYADILATFKYEYDRTNNRADMHFLSF